MRLLILLLSFAAPPAHADRLLCLGTSQTFMMQVDGAQVLFDYLGDGALAMTPPFSDTGEGSSVHALQTATEDWPMLISERACPTKWKTLPIAVEIAVPASAGQTTLTGCCLVRSSP